TGLCVTKLDVLNSLETIKVCVAYRYRGQILEELPAFQAVFREVEPIYEEVPGWQTDISGARDVADLPQEARDYLNLIIRHARVPIVLISVGPRREDTIRCRRY
ncbi:MAG: adenylosuccinate synthetase, partial [Thermoleophilia bacterium]|nr:adenylosuccinate synthetase [Thermoleophilia bacterium]